MNESSPPTAVPFNLVHDGVETSVSGVSFHLDVDEEQRILLASADDVFASNACFSFFEAWHNLGLIGRKDELATLRCCYERVARTGNSQVVLVIAPEGTGKSRLVEEVRKPVTTESSGGFYVSAKFEQSRSQKEVFSAIVEIFTDLIVLVEQGDEETKSRVKDTVSAQLEEHEIDTLSKLIPDLQRLLDRPGPLATVGGSDNAKQQATTSIAQAFVKFKLLCRKFLSAVASEEHPLCCFLDDLQWADEASLEVFRGIASDPDSKYVLLIGAFSGAADQANCQQLLCDLKGRSTSIRLSDLSLAAVNNVIAALLGVDDVASTRELSELVHQKTHGNAFVLKLFLEKLISSKVIRVEDNFDSDCQRWTWDLEEVNARSSESTGLLLAAKVVQLPPNVQGLLKVASCLGYAFQLNDLKVAVTCLYAADVAEATAADPITENMILSMVDSAVKAGVLVSCRRRPGTFEFTHDRVFDAVHETVGTGVGRDLLYLKLGRCLAENGQSLVASETSPYLVADLLNQGSSRMSQFERINLARRNLATAKDALAKCAFVRASEFIQRGISLVPKDVIWVEEYDLGLELHTVGAQLASVHGSPEELANEVIIHGRCFLDRLPAYITKIDFLGWTGRFDDAMRLGLDFLEQLGVDVPRKPSKARVAYEWAMAKRMLSRKTDDEILETPRIQDQDKVVLIKILDMLCRHAYFMNSSDLFVVLSLRTVRLSMKYGFDPEVIPFVITVYGIVQHFMGSTKDMIRFHKLSLRMLDHYNSQDCRCRTMICAYCFGLHFRESIEPIAVKVMEAYKSGLANGDSGFSFLALNGSCYFKFMSGAPLSTVEELLSRSIALMRTYDRHIVADLTSGLHQKVLNLMGQGDNPTVLNGRAMQQDEIFNKMEAAGNIVGLINLKLELFQLQCWLGEWRAAKFVFEEVMRYKDAYQALEQCPPAAYFQFFAALHFFSLYQQSRKHRYRRRAMHWYGRMKRIASAGCPNYSSMLPILHAEKVASRNGSSARTRKAFLDAVDSVEHTQFKAIAYERASLALRKEVDAGEFLEGAKRHYETWGAVPLVSRIDEKFAEGDVKMAVSVPEAATISTGVLSSGITSLPVEQ